MEKINSVIEDSSDSPAIPKWLRLNPFGQEQRPGITRERCPHCGGNVYIDWDYDSRKNQKKCLQCSRIQA